VLSFTGSKCYTLSKSGSTVTAGGTSICSINVNGASSACLSGSVNANGNFTLTTEGVRAVVCLVCVCLEMEGPPHCSVDP